ncbi:hypothetical protein ACJMK2_041851 [Sinanodonta woodiana]|uniref:Cerebral cavernous malformations 2 harmonin-homology domain-containing protein n=1 Tax=Sinanodonta woodiana TaxID=1069815 RepID=A0ABD3W7C8_SINWO
MVKERKMDDLKLKKGGIRSSHNSHIEMRRPLKTPILTPPDFNIEPEKLQDDYVEYETQYLGSIPDVPMEVDITNRTEVLRFIDRGQKKNYLQNEVEVIFSICKQNIKISRRDGSEEQLLRVPINEIAAICYIKDDGIHVLAAKHGTQENCSLAVLHCKTQDIAEAICALVAQCFHLVYTDVMIDLIERTIDIAYKGASGSLSSSDSTPVIQQEAGTFHLPNERAPSTLSKTSNESGQAEIILRDYMKELQKKLKADELAQFSTLLKMWNFSNFSTAPRLPFQEFCEKLYNLYGPERKYLLARFFPFIPEKDCAYFEKFLTKHNISFSENDHGTLNSIHGMPRFYSRSISDVSISSNLANGNDLDQGTRDEFNYMLDEMKNKFEQIDASVGDPTQSYLPLK